MRERGESWVWIFGDTVRGRLCLRVSLLLEQIFVNGLDLLEVGERAEETTRVEEVQAEHRQEDHGTVHSVKVEFCGDDPALPTVNELNGPIHGSDVDSEGAKNRSK